MGLELDRLTILTALRRLSERLAEKGVKGELCLLDGTVMVLAFQSRASTKDVDAIFQPSTVIREEAGQVGEELNLPVDWLNDSAKVFISTRHEVETGDLPQFDSLRVTAPTPEYMLAMKCLAARLPAGPDEKGDEVDIRFLVKHLGLTSASQASEIVYRSCARDSRRATRLGLDRRSQAQASVVRQSWSGDSRHVALGKPRTIPGTEFVCQRKRAVESVDAELQKSSISMIFERICSGQAVSH